MTESRSLPRLEINAFRLSEVGFESRFYIHIMTSLLLTIQTDQFVWLVGALIRWTTPHGGYVNSTLAP